MADLLTQVGSTETSHSVSDWNNGTPIECEKGHWSALQRFLHPSSLFPKPSSPDCSYGGKWSGDDMVIQ